MIAENNQSEQDRRGDPSYFQATYNSQIRLDGKAISPLSFFFRGGELKASKIMA